MVDSRYGGEIDSNNFFVQKKIDRKTLKKSEIRIKTMTPAINLDVTDFIDAIKQGKVVFKDIHDTKNKRWSWLTKHGSNFNAVGICTDDVLKAYHEFAGDNKIKKNTLFKALYKVGWIHNSTKTPVANRNEKLRCLYPPTKLYPWIRIGDEVLMQKLPHGGPIVNPKHTGSSPVPVQAVEDEPEVNIIEQAEEELEDDIEYQEAKTLLLIERKPKGFLLFNGLTPELKSRPRIIDAVLNGFKKALMNGEIHNFSVNTEI
jgi:hypothetical protein